MFCLAIVIPTNLLNFCVEKITMYITKELFLGKDATIYIFYPSMEILKDAILHTFAILEEDTKT